MFRFLIIWTLLFLVCGYAKAIDECSISELVGSEQNRLKLLGPREAFKEGYFNSPGTTAFIHVDVAGSVHVEYEISEPGSVEKIKIIESVYYLLGSDKNSYPEGHFDGYVVVK